MTETKRLRGFALLSPEKRAKVARKGGKAAHAKGVAHHWNSETAAIAGRKGGRKGGSAPHARPAKTAPAA